MKKELTLKDANTAALHQSLERSLEDKLAIQAQIEQLAKMGDAAGKKQVHLLSMMRRYTLIMVQQVTLNALSQRYELSSPRVITGSSNDPLNQTPVAAVDNWKKSGLAPSSSSIDTIGGLPASPAVKEEDFKIVGQRPAPDQPSSRFGEWHRPSSRVSQPPGGKSSNIFG